MELLSLFNVVPISLEQGLAYAFVPMAIMISFRIVAFPDLTVDGSFALGGAIAAKMIVDGWHPVFAVIFAVLGGFIAGSVTALPNTKLKINSLLCGILVWKVLYSINLLIMGKANIPLLNVSTALTPVENLPMSRYVSVSGFFLIIVIVVKLLLDLFLQTQLGLAMRATGDNDQMIRTFGVNTDSITILALGICNALIALSGALVSQDQGFADANMGIGVLVSGLAALIIGETITKAKSVKRETLAAIVGSILYMFFVSLGLRLGLAPTNLKLAPGIMVIISLARNHRHPAPAAWPRWPQRRIPAGLGAVPAQCASLGECLRYRRHRRQRRQCGRGDGPANPASCA